MLVELAWDTAHFGFPVAEIPDGEIADEELLKALQSARRKQIALVYWSSPPERVARSSVLEDFSGKLMDRKVTWNANLAALQKGSPKRRGEPVVEEFPCGPASPALVELGIAANLYSRFRIDSRIPPQAADGLYAVWTERSARREIADAVLVARYLAVPEQLLGMVTIRVQANAGLIGLIAVAPTGRGQGTGMRLLAAAHAWMADHGLARAKVVTQEANEPACQLYQRAGYQREAVRHVYHFWPLAAE